MDATQPRREFKFRLTDGLWPVIREELGKHLECDQDEPDGYEVDSVYFDDAMRSAYWQKKFGAPNRRRVRTRIYGGSRSDRTPTAFLEVKHKLNGTTVKRRLNVHHQEVERCLQKEFPDAADAREALILDEARSLLAEPGSAPLVRITYHRHAFDSGPAGKLRITLDTGARASFWQDGQFSGKIPLFAADEAIMEVKTIGAVPYWFRQLIGRHHILPSSFSKFATALEAGLPELAPEQLSTNS